MLYRFSGRQQLWRQGNPQHSNDNCYSPGSQAHEQTCSMPFDKVLLSLCLLSPNVSVRDEDIRLMGQRGEFRGEYRLGVTAGQFKEVVHSTSVQVFNQRIISKDILERIGTRPNWAR